MVPEDAAREKAEICVSRALENAHRYRDSQGVTPSEAGAILNMLSTTSEELFTRDTVEPTRWTNVGPATMISRDQPVPSTRVRTRNQNIDERKVRMTKTLLEEFRDEGTSR